MRAELRRLIKRARFIAGAPERHAEECRQRAASIIAHLEQLRATVGMEAEGHHFTDAEAIALHDRMRATVYHLPPSGIVP